jgi:hypothetical protein
MIVALSSTSCSKSPVSPALTDPSTDGAGTNGGIQLDDPPAGVDGQGGMVGSTTFAIGQSGTVRAGRFTLVIPKNALRQAAIITIRQPDPNVMQAEFEVSPASANRFARPVTLIADCSNDPLSEVQGETIYWKNGNWQQATAVKLDREQRTLHARTHKLSTAKVDERTKGDCDRGDD